MLNLAAGQPMRAARPLKVAVDATPVLGNRTGIGNYVANLLQGLATDSSLDVRAAAFSLRKRSALDELPTTIRRVKRPVPARLLNQLWTRGSFPPAELVMGRAKVVHGTNYVLPPAVRAAQVLNVHDLSWLHYPELVNTASLAYRELVPRGLARADAVLLLSRAVGDEVAAEYNLPPERLHVVPLGIDPSWYEPRPRPSAAPDSYLLAVGTVEPRKGLDVLLRAYRALLAAEPDVPPLVLAGQAGWGPELERSGIPEGRLIETGYLSHAELVSWVQHASALVFPSRYEGFGLPPLEALAAGTAVVASDLPVLREVLGAHAHYVPVEDADALAGAILKYLDAPRSAQAIAAARQHARTFTWQRTAELTAAVYHSVS